MSMKRDYDCFLSKEGKKERACECHEMLIQTFKYGKRRKVSLLESGRVDVYGHLLPGLGESFGLGLELGLLSFECLGT